MTRITGLSMHQGPASLPLMGQTTMGLAQTKGTWANSGVDISLDNLTISGQKKAAPPSMNQLQGTTPVIPPQPVVPQPGMMMMGGGHMMGVRMMTPPHPPVPGASVVNGSVVSPMVMQQGGVLAGPRVPLNMAGGQPTMPPMMGAMSQNTGGPMSMPNNMGL